MDKIVVALLATAPILAGLAWTVWWLVTDARRDRRQARAAAEALRRCHAGREAVAQHERPRHAPRDDDDEDLFVTVPALLEQAMSHGDGLRPGWSADDPDEAGLVRPYVQDQVPTAVLPKFIEPGNESGC